MNLYGKSSREFDHWLSKKGKVEYCELDHTCQHALITEWLDSIGIFISVHYVHHINNVGFEGYVTHKFLTTKFKEVPTRLEALENCLRHAIKLHNES